MTGRLAELTSGADVRVAAFYGLQDSARCNYGRSDVFSTNSSSLDGINAALQPLGHLTAAGFSKYTRASIFQWGVCANFTAASVKACTNGTPPVIRFSRVM
jgi:hypothetical protein